MYRLIIRERAIDNALQVSTWYEDKQAGLGNEFLDELNNCYRLLENWPTSFVKVKNDFRQMVLKRFPFVIVYKMYDDTVVVYAVFHTSQNPKKKFKS